MPYCVHCGAQNQEGARFCESCGKPLTQIAPGAPGAAPTPPPFQPMASPAIAPGGAKTLVMAGVGLYGVGALLGLMGGDMMALITSLGMAAVSYFVAYAPLAKGNLKAAQNGAAIAGGISVVFAFLDLILGQSFAAIFAAVIAACFGLAWNQLKAALK